MLRNETVLHFPFKQRWLREQHYLERLFSVKATIFIDVLGSVA